MPEKEYILAIESSCDDTAAAVLCERRILSNVVAGQKVHEEYGGVVPELASRAHQAHIVPVVNSALKEAGITAQELSAIAFTAGPGLLGSLLVGTSFAKSLSLALSIPLIDVHHMRAHVLAHLIESEGVKNPDFPFLCLTVSGGHTQIVRVNSPSDFQILGETLDDAAGEAFDKTAKLLGLPYPGGPEIDRRAALGNKEAFAFSRPSLQGYNYSFSGLKTSVLYTLQKAVAKESDFIEKNMDDICASVQHTIIEILMKKLIAASKDTGIKRIAIAGGVSANKGLRARLSEAAEKRNWELFLPPFEFTTDNAAMIAIAGYYKWKEGHVADLSISASARINL